MFNADKVGSPIIATMSKKGAKAWFGTTPPDLSLVARSKGTDWIYTYLRTSGIEALANTLLFTPKGRESSL
jgi:ubiquinol-cytochrome c reductase cytochrome c1 subunit